MAEYTDEMYDLIKKIAQLKARKRRPGTQIFYLERRLEQLKRSPGPKTPAKRAPRTLQSRNRYAPNQAKASPQNRAYVLSREIYDLTQAMVALERMR